MTDSTQLIFLVIKFVVGFAEHKKHQMREVSYKPSLIYIAASCSVGCFAYCLESQLTWS